MDRIGGYNCDCEIGFEGEHCQDDIDECKVYEPCEHGGICLDQQADYNCTCKPEYGGKNCSVLLIGCEGSACKNGGTCKPYLENETEHHFNCTCPNGFHGDTCENVSIAQNLYPKIIIQLPTSHVLSLSSYISSKELVNNKLFQRFVNTVDTNAHYIVEYVKLLNSVCYIVL